MEQLRVLLVDDEPELVYTVAERLTLRGIEAVALTNGDDALKLLEKKEFDVVVLDVKMPGIDGIDLTKRIKDLYPKIRIILLTGRGSKEESLKGLNEGASDYLVKPIDIETLIEKMGKARES